MADDVSPTDALESYLNTINPAYGVHASAFFAAGYKRIQDLQYCQEADVPTVPKGAFRFISARTAGMEF